jgi:hypothetical protein
MRRTLQIAGETAAGLTSGLVATWIMSRVSSALSKVETRAEREREKAESNPGPSAPVNVAVRAAAFTGHRLREDRRTRAGLAVDYAYGAFWGMVWAFLRHRIPRTGPAAGLAFGAALWAGSDELLTWVLRLGAPPWRYPLSTHLRALGAHLTYGLSTEGGLRLAGAAFG